jgi:hypothetical protein
MRRLNGIRPRNQGWLARILAVVALLCGAAVLVFILVRGGDLAPGRCGTGFGWGTGSGNGEAKELLENPNFEASPAAVRDLKAGIVDERLVAALRTVTERHRICIDAFKEGHHFLPGIPDGPLIPKDYGEAGGLPNTHYYGRAADIRRIDGKPVKSNGEDPNVLNVAEIIAGIPPQERPDQIIGPEDWVKALDRSREEGWILDEDQLKLHEDHLHIGYIKSVGTWNTR